MLAGCTGDLSALDPAGPFAGAIARLWWLMFAGATVIFVLVLSLFLIVMRRRGTGSRFSPSSWIWAGGFVLPLTVLVALIFHGLIQGEYLLKGEDDSAMLRVEAHGQRWQWEFRYADAGDIISSPGVLHIPVDQVVEVTATSDDVIHSFWVPRLGGKIDAIPGHAAKVRLLADRAGRYGGICAEYCGTGHEGMRFEVQAHEAEDFAGILDALRQGEAR
ncbi:cytochrome c oxidase subunit II [Ciceribacter sp. L1K22]|uniref:cytochrome c oxidase subunit II n=1 Tax=Ciceribacter sp. L1K22 TaxID=2820275 RepID=UPI001ABDB230|nr:cytochrome c oxidase subunit II [Ciceribacter sp. L1K22]MBO3758950.1 cytochrome c oxidase subunit II [Ciceribacter sp. L1K22]